MQVPWIKVIVFDGVAGARDVGVRKTLYGAHHGELRIEGKAGGNAVGVKLPGGQPFRLHENLMLGAVGKAHHLVLNAGAVARPGAFDLAAVERALMQRLTNDVMGGWVGFRNVTADLARMRLRQKGQRWRRILTRLLGQRRQIDAAPVKARRRAGFKAPHPQRQGPQPFRKGIGRRFPSPPSRLIAQPHVNAPAQEGAGG